MFSLNKAQVSSNKPPGFLFYEKMKEKESPLNLEEEKPTSEDKIMVYFYSSKKIVEFIFILGWYYFYYWRNSKSS